MQITSSTLYPKRRMRLSLLPVQARQSGATLIEILVAVLILSFGVLGMSALQMRALQGNQSSVQRSQALILAQYLMDSMRVDRERAAIGNYDTGRGFVCGAAGITSTGLPGDTLRNWFGALDETMGMDTGDACANVDCDAMFRCTIQVRWNDSKAGGSRTQTFTVSSTL